MLDGVDTARRLTLHALRLSGLAGLAGRFVGGVGAILMLHRVTRDDTSPIGTNRHLTVCPDFLDALLTDMARLGYRLVSMDEVVDRLRRGHRDEFFVAISADDAYRDNLEEALPVLEAHDAPIVIHATPGLVDGAVDLWWEVLEETVARVERLVVPTPAGPIELDASTPAAKARAERHLHDHLTTVLDEHEQVALLRRLAEAAGVEARARTRDALMGWDELRRAAEHPLVTIGAHTVHHYNLSRLDEKEAFEELSRAADILAERLGQRPRHMAFPYGYASAVGAREVKLAREAGFQSAVTTRHGLLRPDHATHLHALPRISLNGRYQSVGHVRTMLSGVTTPMANRGRLTVTV